MGKRSRRNGSGITLVGPGRVGQAMGRLLHEAGLPVRYVAARRLAAARRAVRFMRAGTPITLEDPRVVDAGVLLITTADAAIAAVAGALAERWDDRSIWAGKVVLHTCGSLPSSILQPLRRLGAAIGSVHPYQTIPTPEAGFKNLRGTYWGIEGDAAARKVARGWVKKLGGRSFPIRPAQKPLYHLSAFLVCPTEVTLMEHARRLLKRAGVPDTIARPMLAQFVSETVKNFAQFGARRSLTGPASRGDWATIERHRVLLRRTAPTLLPLYRELLRAMVRLARRRAPQSLFED